MTEFELYRAIGRVIVILVLFALAFVVLEGGLKRDKQDPTKLFDWTKDSWLNKDDKPKRKHRKAKRRDLGIAFQLRGGAR